MKLVCLDSQILVAATPSLARTKKVILLYGKRDLRMLGVSECSNVASKWLLRSSVYISFSGRALFEILFCSNSGDGAI